MAGFYIVILFIYFYYLWIWNEFIEIVKLMLMGDDLVGECGFHNF